MKQVTGNCDCSHRDTFEVSLYDDGSGYIEIMNKGEMCNIALTPEKVNELKEMFKDT